MKLTHAHNEATGCFCSRYREDQSQEGSFIEIGMPLRYEIWRFQHHYSSLLIQPVVHYLPLLKEQFYFSSYHRKYVPWSGPRQKRVYSHWLLILTPTVQLSLQALIRTVVRHQPAIGNQCSTQACRLRIDILSTSTQSLLSTLKIMSQRNTRGRC